MVDKLPSSVELNRRALIKRTGLAVLGSSAMATPSLADESIVDGVYPGQEYQNGAAAIADVPLDSRNEHYLLSGELYTAGGFDANGE